MKRVLKIVIPLILILALLGGAGWYFGFYNRPMTVDMLLSLSASLERSHFTSLSFKAYNCAYSLSDHDPNIAIDLAASYRNQGNYTKAEYTLVNAIMQNPSVELYLALSQTYVEQDKLLDAATMLDKISDPTIKAELDAMRPATPTAQPEQGFYNNYVDVTLSYDGGTLYYTLNGEYPSTDSEPYAEPLSLDAGETIINALAVGENGLVSSRAVFGYTVDGVIENVTLSDPALDTYVRTLLNKSGDAVLRSDELWSITEMEIPEDVTDFSDFSRFTGLTSLIIHNQTGLTYDFLPSMASLATLDLTGCRVNREDLEVIAALPKLTTLILSDCSISTIAPLESATGLTVLDLSDNSIRDISALASLTKLTTLNMYRNALDSLSSLSGLTELKTLDVSFNSISSIDPLGSCVKLETLNVSNNQLTGLSAVSRLSSLQTLDASYNSLTDASPAAGCGSLTELYLSNNSLVDVSSLGALSGLQLLDISYNQVTAAPDFAEGSVLRDFYASYNALEDISGLSGLGYLTYVDADYNNLEDISALDSCPSLAQVNVYGNQVSDVDDLRDRDVIVNFDPTV